MTAGRLRRSPCLLPDLLAAARAEADRLGLRPPDDAEVRHVAFAVAGSEWGPFDRDATERIGDELVARARLRRPLYRLDRLPDGRPAIVVDLDGAADTAARAVADLRRAAIGARRERVLADLADLPPERVARRWGTTVRTLRRWRTTAGRTFEAPKCPLRRRIPA